MNERTKANSFAAALPLRRRQLLAGLGAAGAMSMLSAPAVLSQTREFAGVTLNGSAFTYGFQNEILAQLPEFEELTGIKVNFDLQAFAIYNQRMDLELSTRGSTYDFCNITFPFAGRWIGSNWLTPLDEFVSDPNATPADWDAADFLPAAQEAYIGTDGKTYGYCWITGVQLLAASRGDLMDAEGLAMPTTLDEMMEVARAINRPGVAGFANDKLHDWSLPPILLGMGGRVFRDLPGGDLTPMLDSDEAIKAADFFATLLRDYGPPGVLNYSFEQAMRQQFAGTVNMRTMSVDWLLPVGKSPESTTRETVRYAMHPGGPAGVFPGVNSQAYGIPAGARNKRAAWEFIKWAVSKEKIMELALTKNQITVPRRSALVDPRLRAEMTINGQDVAALYLASLDRAAEGKYMRYRMSSVYPQVGAKINQAIEKIVSGQGSAADAMRTANAEAISDLRRAGAL